MDDTKVTNFFELLEKTNKKIEDVTKKIEDVTKKIVDETKKIVDETKKIVDEKTAQEILDETTAQEILDEITAQEILDEKTAQEILDLAVSLYKKHLAIFEYLFLKYESSYHIDNKETYIDIDYKISKYSVFYTTLLKLIKLIFSLYESIPTLNPKLKNFFDFIAGDDNNFLKTLYRSYTNLLNINNNIYNFIINPAKFKSVGSIGKEIGEFKNITNENFQITEGNLEIYGLKINERINESYKLIGGRKKPTKPKPKGKHNDMNMKDIKELCKANQIKLSRVVEGKRVAYKKKELITKLKRKKLV